MKKNSNRQGSRGFIKMIILIVVALIVLGYLGFNLRNIVASPTVQDNFNYAKEVIVNIWNSYLKVPVDYLWNLIFNKLSSDLSHVSSNLMSASSSTIIQ